MTTGDVERSRAYLEDYLSQFGEHSQQTRPFRAFLLQGRLALAQESVKPACQLLTQSHNQAMNRSNLHERLETGLDLAQALVLAGEQEQAHALLEKNRQLLVRAPEKRGMILYLERLAQWLMAEEKVERAVGLFALAQTMRSAIGFVLLPVERTAYDQAIEAAHTRLGEQLFAQCWSRGEQLDSEAIIAQSPEALLTSAAKPSLPPRKASLPAEANALGLTRRELDVLRLLCEGLTNKEIAEGLVISVVTVNAYLRTIYSKLGVSSRTAAVHVVHEKHLFS